MVLVFSPAMVSRVVRTVTSRDQCYYSVNYVHYRSIYEIAITVIRVTLAFLESNE